MLSPSTLFVLEMKLFMKSAYIRTKCFRILMECLIWNKMIHYFKAASHLVCSEVLHEARQLGVAAGRLAHVAHRTHEGGRLHAQA